MAPAPPTRPVADRVTADRVTAELLLDCRCELAEGIQWHADEARLYWTDIHGRALWRCGADGGGAERRPFDKRLGSFAFAEDGWILCAFEDGLAALDDFFAEPQPLVAVEADRATTRLNDGRCDRQGRFVVGGIDEDGLRPLSSVHRYSPDGTLETLFDGVGCANGLSFSPDGSAMYFADSVGKSIFRFTYALQDLGPRLPFAELSAEEGNPDGSCVDAEGGVWNAQFNGFRVQRFLPDGRRGRRVDLPVRQVTCACFGGDDLDRLYITTGRERFTSEDARSEPTAGGIFVADPGVLGLPEARFGGRRAGA